MDADRRGLLLGGVAVGALGLAMAVSRSVGAQPKDAPRPAGAGPAPGSGPGAARPAAPAGRAVAGWPSLDLDFGGYYGQSGPATRVAQAHYRFTPEAGRYRLEFEVRSGLGNLRFESEGAIDAQGLRPERYLEYRQLMFKRPSSRERRFVREGQAPADGEDVLRVPAGTQDRLSLVAQVSWLARSQPRLVAPGAHLSVPLATWNAVDPIDLQVEAAQDVSLEGGGKVAARRFRRLNDADEQGALEFWLAEDRERLPTQISFIDTPLHLRFVRVAA